VEQTKSITGTKEWSTDSVNCCIGCEHDCRYCYAKYAAYVQYKTIEIGDWPLMLVNQKAVDRPRGKYGGTVMFPTTHDITPKVLIPCTTVLLKLLEAGNKVLIVSKPHLVCIAFLTDQLQEYQSQILFRFTITSHRPGILSYWEPNAPAFPERKACLELAHMRGYQTSVSIEPMLDSEYIKELVNHLSPFVTDTIWIGKMNNIGRRVPVETETDRLMVNAVRQGQTVQRIQAIYQALKDNPKIRWKESCKKVLGLTLATTPGLDV